MSPTGYEPHGTLKPVGDGLWIIDGPAFVDGRFPYPTRATVGQLENGDLWIHSPTELGPSLIDELNALGRVRHLVAPNQSHYHYIADWHAAFEQATVWAAPGVQERAAASGIILPSLAALHPRKADEPWAGQIDQLLIRGSKRHKEVAFFHRASETLILTDLIQAIETAKIPSLYRPYAWLYGIDDSDGKTPPGIRRSFRDKDAYATDIDHIIKWRPRRIIIAHGRCYMHSAVAELERAFRKLLRVRRWESAMEDLEARQRGDL